MNGMRTANRDFTEFLAGKLTEHMGFKRGKLERCLFVHESNEIRVVCHVDDPLICAKPATLDKCWLKISKLVVIKRGEGLKHRILVTYLGFKYRSVHDGDRRGFTVKPTAKYVDECLDIVQLHHAKAVMTPLTEQKSLNLHDETTACDQVQHSLFRAVVGKLQYITGVRTDLMFATKCLSYKLASPTLAVTRGKKVLRYLKGTRELNLYLTIPALKPYELNKTLKHITGFSDADWPGDPVTRKSTSCTVCYVDQFLLTSECRGQGTVALSSGESEMYALGARSATARAVATKQGASRKMKHIHTRFLFIQDLVLRKLFNDVISQDRRESE